MVAETVPDESDEFERPTSLMDLTVKAVPARLIVRGHPINVHYDPDAVTLDVLVKADAFTENSTLSEVKSIADLLINMIVDWDLREKPGGDVVELSPERLGKFGIGLLRDVLTALGNALRMGEANGTRSPRRSSRTTTKARRGS
jgi:hypothetical protein